MIEGLVCLAGRLEHLGYRTPLSELKHAFRYSGLIEAKGGLMERAERIIAICLGLLIPVLLIPILHWLAVHRMVKRFHVMITRREVEEGNQAVAFDASGENFVIRADSANPAASAIISSSTCSRPALSIMTTSKAFRRPRSMARPTMSTGFSSLSQASNSAPTCPARRWS